MKIKIDNREHELIRLCKYYFSISPLYKDIEIVVEVLPLGDAIITNGVDDKVIIERKSLGDLASSIKDGRYEEQSYRLNGIEHHNHNIIYLIEGDMNRLNLFKDRVDKNMLYSAMVSLNHYKGFSVLRTSNIDETAFVICNMAYKIKKSEEVENKKAFYSNKYVSPTKNSVTAAENASGVQNELESTPSAVASKIQATETETETEEEPNYCSVVKKVKKDNITIENIGEIMLCQIPGISSVSAVAIMNQFKTMQNLVTKIKEDENCLKNITYTNAKNQVRKINKTVISNIIKFLKN